SKDILFICGGAFEGIEKTVEKRIGQTEIGFGVDAKRRVDHSLGGLYAKIEPQHLIRYGIIPELVGRRPIGATLSDMDEEAMMRILTEPRNAIIKQYQKFFEMEDVRLEFADEALRAVVKIASQRKTGARGLRAVLEDAMLNIMYDLPCRKDVEA